LSTLVVVEYDDMLQGRGKRACFFANFRRTLLDRLWKTRVVAVKDGQGRSNYTHASVEPYGDRAVQWWVSG
jgi:hypothetical protein